MEGINVEIKRSTFPFNTNTFIKVGNLPVFTMKSGELKEILLPQEGSYDVEVKSAWVKSRKQITITKDKPVIKISFVLPDIYFIISAFIIIPIAVLSLVGMVEPYISGIATLVFFIPILFYTFLASKWYFRISTNKKL